MKILFRLENMMDPFDSFSVDYPANMTLIIDLWWSQSNPGIPTPRYTLEETSVTGNMPVTEMEDRRVRWQAAGDDGTEAKVLHRGIKDGIVMLEPMRLRTFLLEYFPEEETKFIQM